jgi:hypothetical protein
MSRHIVRLGGRNPRTHSAVVRLYAIRPSGSELQYQRRAAVPHPDATMQGIINDTDDERRMYSIEVFYFYMEAVHGFIPFV